MMKEIIKYIKKISFEDLAKICSGMALASAYFLSPIHDWVLYKIYGEGPSFDIDNQLILDQDRPFNPYNMISPKTPFGVSSGVLTWEIDTGKNEEINATKKSSITMEAFKNPKRIEFPSMDLSKFEGEGSFKIKFTYSTNYSNYDLGQYTFNFNRLPNRREVGKSNFTGIWNAIFKGGDFGKFSIIEEHRNFNGVFELPPKFNKPSSVNVQGSRDGEHVWFTVEDGKNGLDLKNGKYKFDSVEGNAVIEGELIYCSPCGKGEHDTKIGYVWMRAPYIQ